MATCNRPVFIGIKTNRGKISNKIAAKERKTVRQSNTLANNNLKTAKKTPADFAINGRETVRKVLFSRP